MHDDHQHQIKLIADEVLQEYRRLENESKLECVEREIAAAQSIEDFAIKYPSAVQGLHKRRNTLRKKLGLTSLKCDQYPHYFALYGISAHQVSD